MYPAFRSLLLLHRQRWLSPCWTQNWEAGDHFYLAFLSSPGDQTHRRCRFFWSSEEEFSNLDKASWSGTSSMKPPQIPQIIMKFFFLHNTLYPFQPIHDCILSQAVRTWLISPPDITTEVSCVYFIFPLNTVCLTVLIILITIILTTIIFRHLIWARHYSKYLTWNNDSFNQHSNPIS